MEWINTFFTQEPFSLVIPVVIIIAIFIYAARRAQIKHLERIRKIDESYHIQINLKASSHRQ
jgi:preprotein translocase subunit YajC